MQTQTRLGELLAIIATLMLSTSAIFIRWASVDLGTYDIAFSRASIAGLVCVCIALLRRDRLPVRDQWFRFCVYGLIVASFLVLYVASLHFTSIAHSLALVYTSPIFVAILSHLWLGEKMAKRSWYGVLITVIGISTLVQVEPRFDYATIIGDLMALGSGICLAIYTAIGRKERHAYSSFSYTGCVYAVAAFWLLPFVVLDLSPRHVGLPAASSVVALGIISTALGHTIYTASLHKASATHVNLIATQEVTIGILLGAIWVGEVPTYPQFVGLVLALIGIVVVTHGGGHPEYAALGDISRSRKDTL